MEPRVVSSAFGRRTPAGVTATDLEPHIARRGMPRNTVQVDSSLPGTRGRARDAGVAAHALDVRRWALAVVAGTVADGVAQAAADAPVDAWRVFCAVERCVLPLLERPAAQPLLASLPKEVREALDGVRLREMQRAMSARMQLVVLSRLAQRRGTPGVVLKGGVAIAEGEPVHVADIDLLLPERDALAFGNALVEEDGFRSEGGDHLDGRGSHHLAPRFVKDAVLVEVHFALPAMPAAGMIARALPLRGYAGLLRPAPEDHLLHLLHHAVVEHLERWGRLRDLLLIARAGVTDEEREAAVSRMGGGSAERAAALAAFAARLGAGEVDGDPFAEIAAANYLVGAAVQRTGRNAPRLLLPSVCAMLNGGGEYRRIWAQHVRTLGDHPGGHTARSLARLLPPLFRPLRLAWRGVGLARAAPEAVAIARQARRLAARRR